MHGTSGVHASVRGDTRGGNHRGTVHWMTDLEGLLLTTTQMLPTLVTHQHVLFAVVEATFVVSCKCYVRMEVAYFLAETVADSLGIYLPLLYPPSYAKGAMLLTLTAAA